MMKEYRQLKIYFRRKCARKRLKAHLCSLKTLRLNLGCGGIKKEGWLNIDIDEKVNPDFVTNAKNLELFEDKTVDEIECCHLFEHLTYSDAVEALNEFYRVLKRKGKLSLELPNLERCVQILFEKSGKGAEKFAMIGIYGQIPNDLKKVGPFQTHKYGWTPETLSIHLQDAGFSEIKQFPVTQTWREATKYDRDMRFECIK